MQYLRLIQDNADSLKRAVSRAVIVSSGQLARGFFSFAIAAILARITGAETFGEYTLFITIFIIASEVPNALDITYIKHANMPKATHENGVYLLQGLILKCAYAVVIGLVAWIGVTIASSLNYISNEKTEYIVLMAVTAGVTFSIYSTLLASFQQRHDFLRLSLLRPVLHGVVLGFLIYFLVENVFLSISDVISLFFYISITLAFISVYIIVSRNKRCIKFVGSEYKNFIRIGLILTMSSALAQVSNRLDVFFITNYLDFDELGYYGVALRISIIVFMMTGMLSTILLPKAPGVYENKNQLKRYLALAGFYLTIQVLMGVLIIVFMDEVIGLFFGKEYMGASIISSILVCQGVINSCLIPFQVLIQVGDKPSLMLYLSFVRITLSVLVLSQLVPMYGLYGAAIGVFAVSFVMVIITLFLFFYMYSMSPVISSHDVD